MSTRDPYHVPARMRERFDDIVGRTDAVAAAHLDAEYADLCRRMAAVLARRRPSPLERGRAQTWAAGLLYAAGWVNFLTDPSQQPHMTTAALARATGVGQSTIAAAFQTIRDALDLVRLDPEWTRPSKLMDNPLAWLVLVDGLPVDLRDAPREVQEAAFRRGLIPFVPGPDATPARGVEMLTAGDDRDPFWPTPDSGSVIRGALAEAEDTLQQMLATHPDATDDELNAALEAVTVRYNDRAQSELGGLSPVAVHSLLDADWQGAGSVIRLDDSISLEELEPSRTLHDARVILAILAEHGSVKATSRGNLPRAFVDEFRERMLPRDAAREALFAPPRTLNEEDLFALHLPRVLLDLSGLVKRRNGRFSRTRRGEQLSADARAGELFTTLIRTHFRRLDLEYMDGIGPAPALQHTIGYTLYQFGRVGTEWRNAAELADALVLPGVRSELPSSPHFDVLALLLETRFLRPLEGFGLAEERTSPRKPGEVIAHAAYRKTSLFDRVLSFRAVPEQAGRGAPARS